MWPVARATDHASLPGRLATADVGRCPGDGMTRHYLDHASTSPLRPTARAALVAAVDAGWGDPSRIHEEGLAARHALESAREQVAAFFGCRSSREVVFTSGATEAIAAAAWGAAERGGRQVVTAVEHSAVRLAAATQGVARALPWSGGPPRLHGVIVPAILAGMIAIVARASREAV